MGNVKEPLLIFVLKDTSNPQYSAFADVYSDAYCPYAPGVSFLVYHGNCIAGDTVGYHFDL